MRHPHLFTTNVGRERGVYFWPMRGIMWGIVFGGGPYRSTRDSRIRTIALGPVLLLSCDVRPRTA